MALILVVTKLVCVKLVLIYRDLLLQRKAIARSDRYTPTPWAGIPCRSKRMIFDRYIAISQKQYQIDTLWSKNVTLMLRCLSLARILWVLSRAAVNDFSLAKKLHALRTCPVAAQADVLLKITFQFFKYIGYILHARWKNRWGIFSEFHRPKLLKLAYFLTEK